MFVPALLLLGCDSGDSGDTAPVGSVDERVGVVVVGAGPAGLAAAIELEAAGADYVVLEREAEVGGAGRYAGGLMMFTGSSEQEASGIADGPDTLRAEWHELTGGDPEDPWFLRFADDNVVQVHDWLAGFGASWDPPKLDPSGGALPRIHPLTNGGQGLVDVLAAQVPGARIRLGATADELLVDGDRVVGVAWSDADGTHTLGAEAVIVATGGFLRQLQKVRELYPDTPDEVLLYASAPEADGAGFDMLLAAGAATQNLQAIGFYAHAHADPADPHEEIVSPAVALNPWLNLEGRRFADEWQVNSFHVGRTRMDQPGASVWLVGDASLLETEYFRPSDAGTLYGITQLEAAGIAVSGDTLGGLAGDIGVPAETMIATIDTWNDAVLGLGEDPYRTELAQPGNELATPPYFAVPLGVSVAKNFGGVDTDVDGRVLRADGAPLEGVWAAGEVSGMAGGSLVGDYGFTGSLTAVVLSGRVAGRSAAAAAE